VLGYDADDAGQNAALKIYQWEDSYEIRLSVADLPRERTRPTSVRRTGPPGAAVEAPARSSSSAWSGSSGRRPASVEGRAAAAKAAVALVAEHPSDLVRDQYLMQLAEQVGIDVDRLRQAAAGSGRPDPGRRPEPAGTPPPRPPARDRSEIEALRVAVHEPGLVAALLDEALFVDPVIREAYESWRPRLRSTRHSNAPEVKCTTCWNGWRWRISPGSTTP